MTLRNQADFETRMERIAQALEQLVVGAASVANELSAVREVLNRIVEMAEGKHDDD